MPALKKQEMIDSLMHEQQKLRVVIVGTGIAGIRAAIELLKLRSDIHISIYGDEPWLPYNRVMLSAYLAGKIKNAELFTDLHTFKESGNLIENHNCAVVKIDRKNKQVLDRFGRISVYDKLILATGSSPHKPQIGGVNLQGVYTFRDLNDADKLYARQSRSRKTVVIGGGFLGIETAKAMQQNNTGVVIVEHNTRLMARQLDIEASVLLQEYLNNIGIEVFTSVHVKQIEGTTRVSAVLLSNDKQIHCDTIILATGIRPNIALAREAGLPVGAGIKVNEYLQTADENIFAIGECAQFDNQVYGLAAPGIEQATVVAHIVSGKRAIYTGSQLVNRIKVIDTQVFSFGIPPDDVRAATHKTLIYRRDEKTIYRKIILKNGKPVGCIGLGEWSESARLQEAIKSNRPIWLWQQWQFIKTGFLWKRDHSNVNNWPASGIVCNCKSVTRGNISDSLAQFSCTDPSKRFEQVQYCTGASSVCGTCRPLVMELCGAQLSADSSNPKFIPLAISLTTFTFLFFLLALAPIPYSTTVTIKTIDMLWQDNLIKQVTGFSLLGFSLLGLMVSVRKRMPIIRFGKFESWRLLHLILGALTLLVLIFHTGFNVGANLNAFLMLSFLGVLSAGAVAGAVISMEPALNARTAKRMRQLSVWLHIFSVWPLPVLLGFHVLASYYF